MKTALFILFLLAASMAIGGVLSGKVIVLDPGHGGIDDGAIGVGGLLEKKINLDVALDLCKILTVQGATVYMTRKTDKAVYLKDRIDLANKKHADLFLCIHHNSVENAPEVDRTQVFYWSATDTSKMAAGELLKSFERLFNLKGQLIRNDFKVLRLAKVPAVLVESCFMSSPQRAKWLRDPHNLWREALALDDGVLKYFDDIGGENK